MKNFKDLIRSSNNKTTVYLTPLIYNFLINFQCYLYIREKVSDTTIAEKTLILEELNGQS